MTCVYAGGHSGEADIPRYEQVRGSIPSPARRRKFLPCNLCYAIAMLIRPLLLVDVDGVLNPYAADTCPEGYCEFNFFEGEEPVRLADVHGKWLRELGEVFNLVWATGWGDEAPRRISPVLGLPEFSVIVFPRVPFPPVEKLPAIRYFVGTGPSHGWMT